MAIAGALGLLLGLVAGYGPRWLDGMLVLLFDSLNSLPMIMFALAIITVLGAGTGTLILVIAATSFPSYARLIRAQTLALKNSDFILAERLIDACRATHPVRPPAAQRRRPADHPAQHGHPRRHHGRGRL